MTDKKPELFDTCVLIDYLNGIAGAVAEINAAFDPAISQITWIEVMVGTKPETEAVTRQFLARFRLFPLDTPISERAVAIRQGLESGLNKKPKLPDALILATAKVHRRMLVTRNDKDFPEGVPGVRLVGYPL